MGTEDREKKQAIALFDWHGIFLEDPFVLLDEGKIFQPGLLDRCLDRDVLHAFLKGELVEWEFFHRMFRDSQCRKSLAHPEKFKKHLLSGLRKNDKSYGIVGQLRSAGIKTGLIANFPLWYNHVPGFQEKRFNYAFVSCEVGALFPGPQFRLAIERIPDPDPHFFLVTRRKAWMEAAREYGWTGLMPEEIEKTLT